MAEKNGFNFSKVFFYLFVLVVVVFLFLFAQDNSQFFEEIVKKYGLVGLFIGTIVGTATVLFPLPIDVLIVLVGANPSLVGFASFGLSEIIILSFIIGLAAAIGEMTSYLAGVASIGVAENLNHKEFAKIKVLREKLKESGMVLVFFGALIPVPFDLVGIAAGLIKFDPVKLFIAAFLGKSARYFLLLLAISFGIEFIAKIFGA